MKQQPVTDECSKSCEKRTQARIEVSFDKAFPVVVRSEIFGDCTGIARNISLGGMLVEMVEPLPLGCFVTVRFHMPDSQGEIAARAEVKHHYCFNFGRDDGPSRMRAMGMRFVEFVADSAERWGETFARRRVLH